MNRYLIDINGLGIRQAMVTEEGIQNFNELACAIAFKKGSKTIFGIEAEAARIHAPRDLCEQFWERLDTECIARGNFQSNHAELAALHLDEIYRKDLKAKEVVCIIPTHYQENQRRILTAIAQNNDIPLRYIIQRSLAHCSSLLGKPHIQVDLGFKILTVSWLASQPAMSVVESSVSHDIGYENFLRRWLNGISAEFINQWRIDPLHSAESEQRIRTHIPSLLETLATDPLATFPVSAFTEKNEAKIQVTTEIITGWSISLLTKILNEVKKLIANSPSCAGVHLSFEAGRLPGLKALITNELDIPVVSTLENEIFKGVSGDWPPLASDDRCLYLPYR